MRYLNLYLLSVALLACHGLSMPEVRGLRVRQETTATTAPPPTSTATATESGRPTEGPTLGESGSAASTDSSESGRSSDPSESSRPSSTRDDSASSSDAPASETAEDSAAATTEVPNLGPSQTSGAPASATSEANEPQPLPLPPRITPAFGITGVILILTGIGYGLIGVKHRLVQIFLSNGYLAALAVTVLVDYVMKPPISDAVQGAYFVAAFMTGSIFGGGALIFKEVTEGFGCLLGGFCLSMWFLCLKPGGLVANQTGKGIMIGVFCVAVWALSWSHWTRNYGLIGSTAFAGATAFVLGVDCFSRAGLKEFWFYIWELNNDLFPLGTTTYPMTRGMIVELIAIVLVTIIGIMSQIKLWKVVRDRRQRRDAVKLEDERRQEVVEEVIGRHLERQNDRDRGAWERQYGNTLSAKRATVLWTEAHPEKTITHITPYEDKRLSSTDSLEMSFVAGSRSRRSKHASKSKRESSVTVNAIPEETEEATAPSSMERQKALVALDPAAPAEAGAVVEEAGDPSEEAESPTEKADKGPEVVPLPFKTPVANDSQGSLPTSVESNRSNRLQEPKDAKKRRSLLSLLSRSPRLSTSSDRLKPSESQDRLAADASVESLALPSRRTSRASSLAATLDEANDLIDLKRASRMIDFDSMPGTPTIVVSPVEVSAEAKKEYESLRPTQSLPEAPPSPTEIALELEEDPEELARPVEQPVQKETKAAQGSTVSGSSQRQGSDSSIQQQTTGPSSVVDGLTKGALEQVPSQVSHVVMSYRTNEWAKHIADAEAPMFAEPEQIKAEDNEPAVQLAPPGAPSSTSTPASAPASDAASSKEPASTEVKRTLSASSSPPPPHVASSTPEGIVANVQEPQRTISRSATAPVVAHVPVIASPPAARPSLKGKRFSTGNRNSTAIKPIQENEVTTFVRSPSRQQSSSPMPQRVMSPTHGAPAGANRLSTGSQSQLQSPLLSHPPQQPYSVSRNTSRSSLQGTTPGGLSRSSSYMSGVTLPALMGGRSETRLDMYESRQPVKRDADAEQQRREALLTEWRISQQQQGSMLGGPGGPGGPIGGGLINQIADRAGVEARRAQMLLDREHQRLMDDQQRATRQHKQLAMDQVMRRPEMQDLHREAMRKMQAKVEEKGKTSAA